MKRQSPHVQQQFVTTGLCAGSKKLASGYQNASLTIKGLHMASCQADRLHLERSVKQFKTEQVTRTVAGQSVVYTAQTRPDTSPAGRVKERPPDISAI